VGLFAVYFCVIDDYTRLGHALSGRGSDGNNARRAGIEDGQTSAIAEASASAGGQLSEGAAVRETRVIGLAATAAVPVVAAVRGGRGHDVTAARDEHAAVEGSAARRVVEARVDAVEVDDVDLIARLTAAQEARNDGVVHLNAVLVHLHIGALLDLVPAAPVHGAAAEQPLGLLAEGNVVHLGDFSGVDGLNGFECLCHFDCCFAAAP